MSTMYEVTFEFGRDATALANNIKSATGEGVNWGTDGLITMLCSEAQLPNVSSLTGQTNNVYMGEGQVNYAYNRLFTDISLGWLCDKDMTPLKFLQEWHDFIYTSTYIDTKNQGRSQSTSRVKYPVEYEGTIKIRKLTQSTGRTEVSPITYILVGAFPHSIDATPLSYGSSQVVNVSASFYYTRYFVDTPVADVDYSR